VKLSGAETTIERGAVQDFRASLRGPLFSVGQEGYDGARRVWNGMIDKHPALIARCADAADVVRAVTFAKILVFMVKDRAKPASRDVTGKEAP
jgi:hypothetical protein